MLHLQKGKYFGTHKRITRRNGLIISDTEYTHEKVDWHYHENIYFTFMLNGSLYEANKKESYTCSAGDLIFHNAQEAHYNLKPPGYARGFHIEIEKKWLNDLSLPNSISEGSLKIEHPATKSFIRKIFIESKNEDNEQLISIDQLLINILSFTQQEAKNMHSPVPKWVKVIKELLAEELHEKISLTYLSSRLGIHPVHLSRDFTRYFKTTIGEYLRRIKVDKAALLLSDENLSLSDITFQCRFADQSHFNRCFKEIYNITPLQFRQRANIS